MVTPIVVLSTQNVEYSDEIFKTYHQKEYS